jgi:epoxyqueuosine reductase QueG
MGGYLMSISEELRDILLRNGAALVGYGDLTALSQNCRRSFDYGVSIAVKMTPEIVKGIEKEVTAEYYDENMRLNNLLDRLCEETVRFLESKDYLAYAQTTYNVEEDELDYKTALPHKTVATRAGIGWIGNCALLVTEQFGSAIRISSVLTNAPLETASPVQESRCGNCTKCRDGCPGRAVSGKNWRVELERADFFNAFSCRKAARERAAKTGINDTSCGLCILNCPWTQKYINGNP